MSKEELLNLKDTMISKLDSIEMNVARINKKDYFGLDIELLKYIRLLEQQLSQANKKLEEIKVYCESNINYYNDPDEGAIKQCEIDGLDILSIMGGE